MSKHVIDDAKRCLQCSTPMCSRGCPVHTPIRNAIRLLLDSKIEEAGRLLFENNPLSLVCCHICPQENQCEGHCVMGKRGSPVQISAIEEYISDYYLSLYKPTPTTREAGKIAIIGSGPAGITIAFFLARRNYDITIFEGNDKIGGIMRYGIPEFRLPKRILDRLMEVMVQTGIHIKPHATIGSNLTIDELFRDGFDAIFMGTGVWRPYKMGIKGESLGNVHYAIEYLRNPAVYSLGKRLAVIGAGNVAMDVARTALRQGCEEVHVICNGGDNTVTARPVELQYTLIDGAKLQYHKSVVEFTEQGPILCDSQTETDDMGIYTITPIRGTEELLEVDSTIIAVGQGPRAVVISTTTGINVDRRGLVEVDRSGQTTREGVFASGDVVSGARTVVEAVRVSREVAQEMDKYVCDKYGRPYVAPVYAEPHND